MRRLIANFMLVNVGLEWAAETLPSGVEEAVKKSKRKGAGEDSAVKGSGRDYLNVLHTLDFIHLGEILFNPYSKKTTQDLYARLKDVKTPEDVATLQDFIPQSNWKRYFQKLVDCEDSYLESRWKKLYDLRCKVAHNALMTGQDLDDTRKLIDEVKPKLLDAIGKLSNVTVPAEEVELVAESAARSVNTAVGEFIGAWQQLEAAITRMVTARGGRNRPAIYPARELRRMGILDEMQANLYDEVRRLRNRVVHGPATDVPVELIQRAVADLRCLLEDVGGDYVERLRSMVESEREAEIDQVVANTNNEIMNSEEFASAIAETNASAFDIDQYEVGNIDLSDGECVVQLTYSASGDQEEDKAYSGNRVTGEAVLVIDSAGSVGYRNVTAEVDHSDLDGDEGEK
jgi:hypothetical protein